MNESSDMVTYKWEQGVYSLEDLIILVKFNEITPEQFHEITGFNYAGIVEEMKNPD